MHVGEYGQMLRKLFVQTYSTLRGINSNCVWAGIDSDKIFLAKQTKTRKLCAAAMKMRQAYDNFYKED